MLLPDGRVQDRRSQRTLKNNEVAPRAGAWLETKDENAEER